MKQINLHVTKEFLQDLKSVMKLKGINTKSGAIRFAIQEVLKSLTSKNNKTEYRIWLGMGLKAPLREKPRFPTHDSLWDKS